MKLTPQQLHILQHSLGCDKHGQSKHRGRDEHDGCLGFYRNHFQTSATSPDGQVCESLVALGFMRGGTALNLPFYSVTPAGVLAMDEQSPSPPKLTRAQERYRAWRRFDGDISFIDYCYWIARRKKEGRA